MAPRNGPRVKVISPNSEKVYISRSVSVASSVYSSGCLSPRTAPLSRSGLRCGEPQGGEKGVTCGDHSRAAYVSPQSECGVLANMGVNVSSETSSRQGKSAPYNTTSSAAPIPELHTPTPTPTVAAFPGGGSVNRVKPARTRRSLPNFFEEAEFSNGSGTNRQLRPPQSSTSRSHSRSHTANASATGQRQHSLSRKRAEDEDAIRRATAALEQAGGSVLRRPFHGGSASTNNGNTICSALGGHKSSLPAPQQERPGLRLPPTIPYTAHQRRHRNEDGDCSDKNSSIGSTASSYRRARSWAESPPRGKAPFQQPIPAAEPSFFPTQPVGESAVQRNDTPRVCPGMFSGLSAIPVDENLFSYTEASYTSGASRSSAAAAATIVRAANTATAACGGVPQQRYCVRPLWSLVGTFKTGLSGLVTIDFHKESLRWPQRNPKGGRQTIHVLLADILDVFTTKVVQEDELIEERQFTVVVRTSTRPSQVVFGFSTVSEANHMRNILKRR